jgi:hypothetical protein
MSFLRDFRYQQGLPPRRQVKLEEVQACADYGRDQLQQVFNKRGIETDIEALLECEPDYHKYRARLYADYKSRLLFPKPDQLNEDDTLSPPPPEDPDDEAWGGPNFTEAWEECWIQECALRQYVLDRHFKNDPPAMLLSNHQYRERARLFRKQRERLEAEDALARARGTPSESPTIFCPLDWGGEPIDIPTEREPRKKPVNRTQEWLKTLETPAVEELPQLLSPIPSKGQEAGRKPAKWQGDKTQGSRVSKSEPKTKHARRGRTTPLLESELSSGICDIKTPNIEVLALEDVPQLSPNSSKDPAKDQNISEQQRNKTQGSRTSKTKPNTKKSTEGSKAMLMRESKRVSKNHTRPMTRSRQRALLNQSATG